MTDKVEEQNSRDYNSISPSAKSLLLMKGHTNIPYARQTAGLVQYPKEFNPDFKNRDMTFWARTLHFENRYWSIDQLLSDLSITNLLELSSGFSFRGMDITRQNKSYYIDTDLPEMIETKKEFISKLRNNNPQLGNLEFLPLNALDEKQFREVINRFPAGEIVILNEGLLMYLDNEEKEKLLKIIHTILKERGGYWITADIYLKNRQEKLHLNIDHKTKEFFEQHHLENNKFESFNDAAVFFRKFGFVVDREATVKRSKLSSMKYFRKSLSIGQLFKMRKYGKMQATWRLKIEK